jgi:hypothetical protein
MRSVLEQGRDAVSDPNRVLALLVTTPTPEALVSARYLWGSAQQIGLTVGGVLVSQGNLQEEQEGAFAPLPHQVSAIAFCGWGLAVADGGAAQSSPTGCLCSPSYRH